MKYKIIINGAEINTTPKQINTIKSSFKRDRDLKGIFVEELIEIIFVGDGYCKLKEIQEEKTFCEFPIIVYQICNRQQKLRFNGIADTFTIKTDLTLGEAKVTIKDNSPINRILQNKDSIYYPTSLTALDGATSITAVPTRAINFRNSELDSPTIDWEDIEVYEAMELLQGNLNWITANGLTVQSDFFEREYETEINQGFTEATANNYRRVYEIVYSTPPTVAATTIIRYRNFYGIETTETIVGAGANGTHLRNVWTTLLKFFSISNLGDRYEFGVGYDFNEWDYATDNNSDTIRLRSFFDNTILSIECDESVVNWSLTTDTDLTYIDSGNNTCFLTGKMLRKISNDNFSVSFKWLIEELDKVYNINFVVSNGVFQIENEQGFQTGTTILTIDNATNLNIESSLDNLYSKIKVADDGLEVKAFIERDFISTFCGIDKPFDAKTESIKSWRDIYGDIDNPSDNNDDKYYLVQGESNTDTASMVSMQMAVILSSRIVIDNGSYAYIPNFQFYNNKQVIRHFQKFIGDLSVSPYKKVKNTEAAELVYDISFEGVITEQQYNLLLANNLDQIKVKSKDSDYYSGIVDEVSYEYSTGIGTFVMSGKKL